MASPSPGSSPGHSRSSSRAESDNRRKRRDLLKQYYAEPSSNLAETAAEQQSQPLNIDGSSFNAKKYTTVAFKKKRLPDLVELDRKLVGEIRTLDSDIQTLVYENYNKFISATDTVRQMKSKVESMEAEMARLDDNMNSIMTLSQTVSESLATNRDKVSQLSGVHILLKKLQFLFELPGRLKKCIEMSAYRQAVNYYTKATGILEQYEHIPSFSGIRDECQESIMQLTTLLRARFNQSNEKISTAKLCEAGELLLNLGEPPAVLAKQYLDAIYNPLDEVLCDIEKQSVEPSEEMTLEKFIGFCNSSFLSDLKAFLLDFKKIFLTEKRGSLKNLNVAGDERLKIEEALFAFVDGLNDRLLKAQQTKFDAEIKKGDDDSLLHGLGSIYSHLMELNEVYIGTQFERQIIVFINYVLTQFTGNLLKEMFIVFDGHVLDIKEIINDSQSLKDISPLELGVNMSIQMRELVLKNVTRLEKLSKKENVVMERPEIKKQFFDLYLLKNFVFEYFNQVCEKCKVESGIGVLKDNANNTAKSMILILTRHLLDLEATTIGAILHKTVTSIFKVERNYMEYQKDHTLLARNTAQALANHYVYLQGMSLAGMIRKSVETRDWMTTGEPRMVRSAMKRVVEDLTMIVDDIGMFFESDRNPSRSSDSGRYRQNPRTSGRFTRMEDINLMSNIQKLFADRIEIFGNVEFSKPSMETMIVNIFLKAYIECVRLRTFGKFGYQQLQVDVEYLRKNLWSFVKDEQFLIVFLEEIMNSAASRCLEPIKMDQSIVDAIV